MGMVQDSCPKHHFYQLFSSPGDFGFTATSRRRTWVIGAHLDKTVCLLDPFAMLESIREYINNIVRLQIPDYLVASDMEIRCEAENLARRRCVTSFNGSLSNLTALLTCREIGVKNELDFRFEVQFQRQPADVASLIYFLGDSAKFCSWSAISGQVPCYRVNARSGLYWIPSQRRWLTSKERLVSMGWPVTPEQAGHLKVPCLGATDVARASDLCGNAMHFQSAGILQLVALASFGPMSSDM